MKIKLTICNESVGTHLIDAWYSYQQSMGNDISIVDDNADFSILFDYMPCKLEVDDIADYDLVLLCNGGEPLATATPTMQQLLKLENVYFVANSLGTDLSISNKILWFPHNILTCRDLWTRHFYPQYYENHRNWQLPRSHSIIAINGSNRTWRHYFFELLQQVPEVKCLSNISVDVKTTTDSQWESIEDQQFRDWVNDRYSQAVNTKEENYFNQAVTIGINGKFGKIAPGYFVMPEYFEHSCVLFPEASWQNNELCITEKALKCFYAKSLPFPIGGANVNALYNQIGYQTAWNLLPEECKMFDSELDHAKRYQGAVQAVQWLVDNSWVFDGEVFKQAVEQNQQRFLMAQGDYQSVEQFAKLIKGKYQ